VPYVREVRLGSFWDEVYKGAGTIADIAHSVQQGAVAGEQVQAGNAQITVVPTKQGVVNFAGNYGPSVMPYLLAGGAALALVLATRGGKRRR
jgi:hypothetical protein